MFDAEACIGFEEFPEIHWVQIDNLGDSSQVQFIREVVNDEFFDFVDPDIGMGDGGVMQGSRQQTVENQMKDPPRKHFVPGLHATPNAIEFKDIV